jgi:hypothetical protein
MTSRVFLLLAATFATGAAYAADQSIPGAGNSDANRIASQSKIVTAAQRTLMDSARSLRDQKLRQETLDAFSPSACVRHRVGVGTKEKKAILLALVDAGFVSMADASGWGPGALNGVFPPLVGEEGKCPTLSQPFLAAPANDFHSHHSHPGGLATHTAQNVRTARSLASSYAETYQESSALDLDLVVGAPLWHDWAKAMVFQWNADGSEFAQLTIAKIGAHHILGLAEAMARGLSPAHVAAQASVHTPPNSTGNLATVVGYIKAAAIIAQVNPVKAGYLIVDSSGNARLPSIKHLGDIDSPTSGKLSVPAELVIAHVSDADWALGDSAISIAEALLARLAERFGHAPTDSDYNTAFRNVVLSELTAEKIQFVFQRDGLDAVAKLLEGLKQRKRI